MKIKLKIISIERLMMQNCNTPIVPALFADEELVAFGSDIIIYFKRIKDASITA